MGAENSAGHLILAGGGHSHALVLRRWAMRPKLRPSALISLVNRTSTALYSGMVPGVVAGLYKREQAEINLRQLCQRAGVCFVQAEMTGIDLVSQQLLLDGRPGLQFDWLSLDVGGITASHATKKDAESSANTPVLPVKPLEALLKLCESLALHHPPDAAIHLVGSGAAAVELALALKARGLKPWLQPKPSGLDFGSITTNRLLHQLLEQADIALLPAEKDPTKPSRSIQQHPAASLLCTGTRGTPWLAASGLPVDGNGRVRTANTLAVEGYPNVFASGDCGVISNAPRPASGVWAVRAAPTLAINLQRAISGRDLHRWRPQRSALQLLSTPNRQSKPRAVAIWGSWAIGPWQWLWLWKDAIDRSFMARFSRGQQHMLRGAEQNKPTTNHPTGAMSCRGCAAKLAAAPLKAALKRLDQPIPSQRKASECSLLAHDDASCIHISSKGDVLLQSVDGFPALVNDPWLNARLTTVHACSDLWACGASVSSAQAVVTVPAGAEALQSELLLQTLAGIRSVLDPLGAELLGGHSLEARDLQTTLGAADHSTPLAGLSLSLTVNGTTTLQRLWPKGSLRNGDALILTRPIGTGVLFAALMAGSAKPEWIDAALQMMQQTQASVVDILARHHCHACTDITGFGLLGHLGEMLDPCGDSGDLTCAQGHVILDAEAMLQLAFPGALTLLQKGYHSTLAPANRHALELLNGPITLIGEVPPVLQDLLIDPQTCGPLLAAVPSEALGAALDDLKNEGYYQAACIGHVIEAGKL